MSLLGAALAAVQLLPTWELSRLSIRAGGLSYRQAVSFSFDPRLALRGLLPTFGYDAPLFSEYVAYVGILGLLLAWLGWQNRRAGFIRRYAFISGVTGLFLALGIFNPFYYVAYRLIPGFAWFRAPARWLLLTAWGVALLAGLGFDALTQRGPTLRDGLRFAAILGAVVAVLSPFAQRPPVVVYALWGMWLVAGLALLVVRRRLPAAAFTVLFLTALTVELFWARRPLAYTRPTAPQAYDDLRPSISHLRTDPGLFRLLSLSALTWDPGDLADMRAIWQDSLSEREMYDLVVATKEKEILAPNLPMRYDLQSVDGYGGGILPLARYSSLQRALLASASGRSAAEVKVNPDGRLRERLPDVPPVSLLSLLNVKYVIRDKLDDRWVDGVYYDLGLRVSLHEPNRPTLTLTDLPDFWAGGLGLVSTVRSSSPLSPGEPVVEVIVTGRQGQQFRWTVQFGRDSGPTEGGDAGRARPIGRGPEGMQYLAIWNWGDLVQPRRIELRVLRPDITFIVRGITLREPRTATFDTVTVDPDFALTYSGDVKIYRNRRVLPRAFLVHRAVTADDETVIAALENPAFHPDETVYLALSQPWTGKPSPTANEGTVVIRRYAPERIELDVSTRSSAYLVLTDSYYPGWRAWVDGQPAPILRADLLFRAVQVPAGEHHVRFAFQPSSLRWGALISLLTGLAVLVWLAQLLR